MDTILRQQLLELLTGILAAQVRVMQQSIRLAARKHRLKAAGLLD